MNIINKYLAILALPLLLALSGCAAGPSQPSPAKQMAQYQLQLNEWRTQQAQLKADEDYYRLLDKDLRVEEIYQKAETQREAIRRNAPLSQPQPEIDKKEQDKLREKCIEGFGCESGDCQYPPDELCASLFGIGASGNATHPASNGGSHVYLIGATVENFFYRSAGSVGSDRSNHSKSVPVARIKDKRTPIIQPPAPPAFPKSSSEVWGGVVTSVWKDTLGAARSIAPWFFGADILKTMATSPNNYVSVGDDLTAGGDNNTSRGDYVSKPVVFTEGE